jgi:glutathione S-transferase
MIALYHSPFTRSHLIRFALEELGLPHELRRVDVSAGEHKSAAYLQLNPLGQLPTLVDEGTTLREAAAIALHLGDRASEPALVPSLGAPERAPYYQWIVFSVASELLALSKIVLHTRVLPEALRVPAIAEAGHAEWKEVAHALSLGLEGRPYLLGRAFSLADVMVGGALWLANFVDLVAPFPVLQEYYARVSARPAFHRAYADAVAA